MTDSRGVVKTGVNGTMYATENENDDIAVYVTSFDGGEPYLTMRLGGNGADISYDDARVLFSALGQALEDTKEVWA